MKRFLVNWVKVLGMLVGLVALVYGSYLGLAAIDARWGDFVVYMVVTGILLLVLSVLFALGLSIGG